MQLLTCFAKLGIHKVEFGKNLVFRFHDNNVIINVVYCCLCEMLIWFIRRIATFYIVTIHCRRPMHQIQNKIKAHHLSLFEIASLVDSVNHFNTRSKNHGKLTQWWRIAAIYIIIDKSTHYGANYKCQLTYSRLFQ